LSITLGCVGFICWNINLKCLKHLKIFMYGLKIKYNLVSTLFVLIMEGNILPMNLKSIFINMGLSMKPYNPWHNGVVERMNGTLLNMVHSMLFFKNVKLMFWADEVLCAMYLKKIHLMLLATRLLRKCGVVVFLRWGVSKFLVPLVMHKFLRIKETN